MATVKLEVQLSSAELIKAVEQLSHEDLEQFVSQVIMLQAQRKASNLQKTEAELLLKINQGVPLDIQNYYNELIVKRENETLNADEYQELLRLTEQIEKLQAQRIEYLAELASLREKSLTELINDLGINTQIYV
ncbi:MULTISPECIES: STAS/SEC14 domain-containing protein [unclassified Anabaena]|uniref:STAS/SEC14 domain-containing protein n=1 Tax=unclassified Anabaena TaxID=2619674 RepID=UPI0039C637DA